MARRLSIMAAGFALMSAGALAGPLDGVYLSNGAHCGLLTERGGVQAIHAVQNEDVRIFTLEDGIMGDGYHCDPARVEFLFDGAAAVMTAFCQGPGYEFPDLISISSYDDTQIRVTQQSKAHLPAVKDGTTQSWDLFTRCTQIEELK